MKTRKSQPSPSQPVLRNANRRENRKAATDQMRGEITETVARTMETIFETKDLMAEADRMLMRK
ncbi:MAG TPA: hypothetical protein VKV77_03590 [Methylovirgula sp.]|nr:hypothetical protein [Methylovirgula sp.]